MKFIRRITIGMVLAGVAGPSMAATVDREDLAQCKASLKKVYGDDSRMKLKSVKRHRKGTHMRIQAILDNGEDYLTTCWVDREGVTHMEDRNGVALVPQAYEAEDKVSLAQ